ncbi:hypothetical protein AAVH_16647 [Aphelenchoides avenae]|nr:hypothetical protein AAVH_16647 [Aphelenchus avenae]
MTDEQAQRRLRLNYVVAELDTVLRELLADVPFVTETSLRNKYRQLCGKTLSHELETVGMTLFDRIEMKFAEAFIAVRDSRLPDLLRIKFLNQRALRCTRLSEGRRSSSGNEQGMSDSLWLWKPQSSEAEPVVVNVDLHDSVDSDGRRCRGGCRRKRRWFARAEVRQRIEGAWREGDLAERIRGQRRSEDLGAKLLRRRQAARRCENSGQGRCAKSFF